MKRICVLTMHRVCNYGSALQAWATQEILQRMGFDVKLLDYVFPNDYHLQFSPPISLKIRLARMVMNYLYHNPMKRKELAFKQFRESHLKCTKCIKTREGLMHLPCEFDVYLVGSDQVWNPDVIHEDYSFFLDFIHEDSKKISFASSFSQSNLEKFNTQRITELLNRFHAISVREKNAQQIVKNLTNRNVPICLDPTLLLGVDDYDSLAEESTLKIEGDYILVYVLNYAFNPYPFASRFIEKLSQETGLKVVCIDFSARQHLNVSRRIHLHDAIGPSEFLWLFRHAKYVVTSSFHGTAFALNFRIPFYSIVNDEDNGDDRMVSLLNQLGADDRIVINNSKVNRLNFNMNWELIHQKLHGLKDFSLNYLIKSLS